MGRSKRVIEYANTHELMVPEGEIKGNLEITAEDCEFAPRLMAKLQEIARTCGFPNITITQKAKDPYDFNSWEWTEENVQ